MSSKNDIDSIINNLSQSNYTFDEKLLVKDEIELLKNRARDSRAIYGLNTPIGTNIFSFLEQKGDIVFQLQEFKKSDLDAMIIISNKFCISIICSSLSGSAISL